MEFSTEFETVENLRRSLPNPNSPNWIYVIERATETSASETLNRYPTRGEGREPRPVGLARCNGGTSYVLYVGSKRRVGLRGRIRQHLSDNASSQTYALKLGCWYPWKCRVHFRQYDLPKSAIGSREDKFYGQVLQIIEDSISEELEPMFGKRGGNAK
ncbi:hypothetical protein [Pseudophaeobacter arcticus]